jgi:hypothetical protein
VCGLSFLQDAVLWAEESGEETAMTLFVGGGILSGMVTATCRFTDFIRETVELCAVSGAPMPGDAVDTTAPTDEEKRAIAAQWTGRLKTRNAPPAVTTMTIRAARVQREMVPPFTMAYVQIAFDSIDGISVGALGYSPIEG